MLPVNACYPRLGRHVCECLLSADVMCRNACYLRMLAMRVPRIGYLRMLVGYLRMLAMRMPMDLKFGGDM